MKLQLHGQILTLLALSCMTFIPLPVQAGSGSTVPTRLVILPVNHSQQLVARSDQPGLLTAFIETLKPDAICIETYPPAYVRNDFYDFVYEQTAIILPYARAHGIAIYPIDWEPGRDAMMLAFGSDLDETPLIRPRVGWGAFLTFPNPSDLKAPFLDPQPDVVAHVQRWAKADPADASQDAPRRLYLFRTFLQARNIAAVAHANPGRTILVVVGEFTNGISSACWRTTQRSISSSRRTCSCPTKARRTS